MIVIGPSLATAAWRAERRAVAVPPGGPCVRVAAEVLPGDLPKALDGLLDDRVVGTAQERDLRGNAEPLLFVAEDGDLLRDQILDLRLVGVLVGSETGGIG